MTNKTILAKLESEYFAYSLISVSIIIMIIMALVFNGTGDDGDSIHHYLFDHTAFKHPEHFFNQWAKPLSVLLSSPFAYFGFTWMKIFNVICFSISLIMTYKISQALKIPNAWFSVIIFMCSPYVLIQTLSGLTEPLFSAFLAVGAYLLIQKKHFASILLLSFLPFVRSEGLIILSVLLIYVMLMQKWKLIPLFLAGHAVYGLAGLIEYDSPLWVFMKIPYAHLSTPYGKGDWLHFYVSMPIIVGKGLNIIWNIGMLLGLYKLVMYILHYGGQKYTMVKEELWLVYGLFTAVFLGHTAFWALGIFWSGGLMRVLLCVLPFIAIICLQGFNLILDVAVKTKPNLKVPVLGCFSIFCFLFLYEYLTIDSFQLSSFQKSQLKVANTFGKEWASQKPKPVLYYSAPYLGMLLQDDFDYFDPSQRRIAAKLYDGSPLPYYMYYVWDWCYASFEGGGPASKAFGDKRLRYLKSESDGSSVFHIFMRDTVTHLEFNSLLYSFEQDTAWNSEWISDKKEMKRSIILNKANPYSPAYSQYLKTLSSGKKNQELRVSFKINSSVIPQEGWENARLIFSVEGDGKNISWKGLPIQERIEKENQWATVEFREPLPSFKSVNEKISIVIWNENPTDVTIQDYKIELFE